MLKSAFLSGCALVALAGCTDTYNVPARIGQTSGYLTTADLRLITDRPVPIKDPNNPERRAVCAEPPPDVAKALETSFQASAKVGVPSGANGGGSLGNQTAEQLGELAGRVPGLIALRDGTFKECEAWTNGALGDSAYALTVSRYGDLLATLILADAAAGNGRAPRVTLTGSLAPTVPPNPSTSQASSSSKDTTSTTDAAPVDPGVKLASLDPGLMVMASSAAPATNSPTTNPPAANRSPQAADTSGAASSSDAGVVAKWLAQMQLNFLQLGHLGPLIVACVSEYDHSRPTRHAYPLNGKSEVLSEERCGRLIDAAIKIAQQQSDTATASLVAQRGVAKH